MKFNLKKFFTGNLIGLVLVAFYSIIINISYANNSYSGQPPAFPSCSDASIMGRIKANYSSGNHTIVGLGQNYSGSDIVYGLPQGNALQCYCPNFNPGTQGYQTDWWLTDIQNLPGWLSELGSNWGLKPHNYLASNPPVGFSCSSPSVTPSEQITPTPTVSVSGTPTPTSAVTPTPSTPVPTNEITPSPTQQVTPPPTNNNGGGSSPVIYGPGSSTKAPGAATCNIAFAAPILQGFSENKANGTETYSWWASTASGISKQSLEYGYQIGNPLFGADNLAPNVTSLTINGLNMNLISWLRVGAWQGGCVEWSNWFN